MKPDVHSLCVLLKHISKKYCLCGRPFCNSCLFCDLVFTVTAYKGGGRKGDGGGVLKEVGVSAWWHELYT